MIASLWQLLDASHASALEHGMASKCSSRVGSFSMRSAPFLDTRYAWVPGTELNLSCLNQ